MKRYVSKFSEGNKGVSVPDYKKFKGSLYSRLNPKPQVSDLDRYVDMVVNKVESLFPDEEGLEDTIIDVVNEMRIPSSLKSKVFRKSKEILGA